MALFNNATAAADGTRISTTQTLSNNTLSFKDSSVNGLLSLSVYRTLVLIVASVGVIANVLVLSIFISSKQLTKDTFHLLFLNQIHRCF